MDTGAKLIDLAKEKFGELTEAERKMFEAAATGNFAYCSSKVKEENDPANSANWPKNRSIRAGCIEWLCTNPDASALVTHKGIQVKGARIDGKIDLKFARISFPLYFKKCAFPEDINLQYVEIPALNLEGTHTGPITADNLNVAGSILLRNDFIAEDQVRLLGAKIGGTFECDNSQFINPNGDALNANRMKVDGSVFLRKGFKAEGQVRLHSATIGGNLDCEKGQFINPNGNALNGDGLTVKRNVFFRGNFRAVGEVCLVGATIGGAFAWTGVDSPENVTLDLRSAKIGWLWDREESWPLDGKLFLDGLVYERLFEEAPKDAKARKRWLRLQPKDPFLPQPYEQLATVLRKTGRDADAKKILIAKNKDRAKWGPKLSRSEKLWYHVLGPMIDYGHAPLKAIWVGPAGKKFLFSILFWLVLGCVLFGTGKLSGVITPSQGWAYDSAAERMQGQVTKDYPGFNFIVYSIDSFVPLVDLHQAKYWLPNPNCAPELSRFPWLGSGFISFLRFYLWLHIAAGWMLTTLLVVGLTGLVRT